MARLNANMANRFVVVYASELPFLFIQKQILADCLVFKVLLLAHVHMHITDYANYVLSKQATTNAAAARRVWNGRVERADREQGERSDQKRDKILVMLSHNVSSYRRLCPIRPLFNKNKKKKLPPEPLSISE